MNHERRNVGSIRSITWQSFSPRDRERLAARLSMGFDLAKIASELHLTTAVVAALEADDWRNPVRVCSCAAICATTHESIGMPVESILRQFDENGRTTAPARR